MRCHGLMAILLTGTAITNVIADEPVEPMAEEPAVMRVMSFNIRYDSPHDGRNAWPHRRDAVAELFHSRQINAAGLQEALRSQIDDLAERLPDYGWVGVGRDDGRDSGEFSPIFYGKDRLELLDSGTFWLSATPDQPGSRGWDAALPRIVTWAQLKDRSTGKRWRLFNTHFDHVGVQARLESARLLLRNVGETAGDHAVVVTGDLNASKASAPCQCLIAEAGEGSQAIALCDAADISRSPITGPTGTWNGFLAPIANHKIDYVLVGPNVRVLKHVVLDEQHEGRFLSDHFAVLAELQVAP